MSRSTVARILSLFAAVLVFGLTLGIVANATQTITTPNAMFVTYSLGAGGVSAPITPAAGRAVSVMGTQLNVGFRGVGQVSLLHVAGNFLEWVGLESTSGAAITQGFSGSAGTHIVFIDFSHTVQLEVASPDTFIVHNLGGGSASGNVTMMW